MKLQFYKRLTKNTTYLIAGTVISNLSLFLSNIAMARMLEPNSYGLIVLTSSIIFSFTLFAYLGIPEATTKFIADAKVNDNREEIKKIIVSSLELIILTGILSTLILLLSARFLAITFLKINDIYIYLYISAAWIICTLFIRHIEAIFYGFQEMKYSFISSLIFDFFKLISLIIMLLLGFKVIGIIIGWTCIHLISTGFVIFLFLHFLTGRKTSLGKVYNARFKRDLLNYGKYLYIALLGIYLVPYAVNFIIGRFDSIANVAYFTASFSLASLSFLVLIPLSIALLPALSEILTSKNRDNLINLFNAGIKYVGIFGILIVFIISFFGGEFIRLFYGPRFIHLKNILTILAFAMFFEGFRVITDPLLKATKYVKGLMVVELLKLGLIIISCIFFIKTYSLKGIALSLFVVYFIGIHIKSYYIYKKLHINIWRPLKYFFLPILILGIFSYYRFRFSFFVCAILIIAIFAYEKVISKSEILNIWNLISGSNIS